MPMGEGFWIHQRSGRWNPVYEHLSAILDDPTEYGLSDIQVQTKRGETAEDRRERVLVTAMKRGWIRAALHEHHSTFAYSRLTRRVAAVIFDFIAEVGRADVGHSYQLIEMSSRWSFSVGAQGFAKDIAARRAGRDDDGASQVYLLGRAMGQGRCSALRSA